MNPFGGRKYLAELNRAGQEWEAGPAKGLALILEDTNQEVSELKGKVHDLFGAGSDTMQTCMSSCVTSRPNVSSYYKATKTRKKSRTAAPLLQRRLLQGAEHKPCL